ncbi:hypothetical protein FL857_05985 [Criibacterium bergeronii]|uniref:Uncharacterized protein n=1 Tax=Criibacterium bergeronii TaxID=1871336 RepID=A0A552V6Z7_9FIRM|nr:hypothetical protein [Criibacterium bergeronii]TRW26235.1 hypothetical protein FL857_05985 [Criibacterium bergeronii]
MVSEKEMLKCEGKKIRVKFKDGQILYTFCEEYYQEEDYDESESMLFIPNNLAIGQSEIESIEILN